MVTLLNSTTPVGTPKTVAKTVNFLLNCRESVFCEREATAVRVTRRRRFPPQIIDTSRHKVVCGGVSGKVDRWARREGGGRGSCNGTKI